MSPPKIKKAAIQPNDYTPPGPIGNTEGLIVPKTEASPGGSSAPPIKPTPKEEGWWKRWGSDTLHVGLDVVGLIPGVGEIADGANALIYLAEGDKVNAAISAAAMIPGAGMAATGAKLGKKALGAVAEGSGKAVLREGGEEAVELAGKKAAGKRGKNDGGYDKGSSSAETQLEKNKKKGEYFANKETENFKKEADNVEKEITIKSRDGTKTRVDAIGVDKDTGAVKIQEYKGSETAPLTKNQKTAFPQISETGGEVVGKGKGSFPGGTKIPPTKVEIVRPPK